MTDEAEPTVVTGRVVAPYGHVRVVQLGGGIEVAHCTKMLAELGADVVVVEPVAGHPLRRHGLARHDGVERSSLFSYLHAGKQSVVMADGDLDAAFARADVVVCAEPSVPWPDLHERFPHLTLVTITPFGLDGLWAGRAATDLTLQAASGGMMPRGDVDGAPLMVGGEPGLWFAGAVAAASLLGVLPRICSTGSGELIDVSILESTHIQHGMHPITFASMAGRAFQQSRGVPVPGIEPTSDGFVGFFVITGQQWLDFTTLIGQPQWADVDEYFQATQRRLRAEELLPAIRKWTMSRTTDEIVETAALLRIPVAPIGNGRTLTDIDQFAAEDWFVHNPDGFVQPRRPYRFDREPIPDPAPSPALGCSEITRWTIRAAACDVLSGEFERGTSAVRSDDLAYPLSGLRVADFTGFWAGPLAGAVLAGLGADVIHVEGPRRPDGIRMNSIRAMSEPEWWEWSPLFCGTNTNKRSMTLDLSLPAGQAAALRLLATCDVMIENFSPRVLDQLGLDPDTVRAVNPELVMIRMPAFGLHGPWRDRVGFAQTIEQAVGLAYVTGYEGDVPVIPNGMCDPIAGVYGAVAALAGLAERSTSGGGLTVECPMVGAGLHVAAEQLVRYTSTGELLTRLGNRSPWREQDVFACRGDDVWVAIAVPDADAGARLACLTGVTDFVQLADWCRVRECDQIVDALWPIGVAVARVVWAHELLGSPQFDSRGFLELVDHPLRGAHPHTAWPARFSAGPWRWNRSPAPTFGEHNEAVLNELGYTGDEVEALRSAEVIAEEVLTTARRW